MATAPTIPEPIGPPQATGRKTAFAETYRNKQRTQLIMSFYGGLKFFHDSLGQEGQRHMTYERMDHLVETYFRSVKDLAHYFFRDTERSRYVRLLQVTFDLSFGIFFHLLLKFKETLRLAENYDIDRLGKIVERLQKSPDAELAGTSKLFDSLRQGYGRDLAALDEELKGASDMLDDLEGIFRKIISIYSDNTTILRSLFANHAFFLKVFPGDGIERVFKSMFPETGAAEAYVALGFDFIRSGHMDQAERVFRRAARFRAPGRHPATASGSSGSSGSSESAKLAGPAGPAGSVRTVFDLATLYRTRRMLFIGGNPKASPEAAHNLEILKAFEDRAGIEDLLLR